MDYWYPLIVNYEISLFLSALFDDRWNRQGSSSDDHRCWCLPVSSWIRRVPEECLHVGERVHLPWNSRFTRAKGPYTNLTSSDCPISSNPLALKNALLVVSYWFCRMETSSTLMLLSTWMYVVCRTINLVISIFCGVVWYAVLLQGYHGDTSRTYLCGEVDEPTKQLVKVWLADSTSNCKLQTVSEELVWCNRSVKSACWGAYQPANMVLALRQLERE
jgi:hypothetical protein